ncbi:MAG: hypothetical protein H0U86_02340 [Chloroflexi bacterium]|nr:hypothetical protein [Chloroflexota bacterium]
MLRRILTVPLRFLRWVYAPTGRTRPGHGEIESHMAAAEIGQETGRWAHMEEERLRHRDEAFRGRSEKPRDDS